MTDRATDDELASRKRAQLATSSYFLYDIFIPSFVRNLHVATAPLPAPPKKKKGGAAAATMLAPRLANCELRPGPRLQLQLHNSLIAGLHHYNRLAT